MQTFEITYRPTYAKEDRTVIVQAERVGDQWRVVFAPGLTAVEMMRAGETASEAALGAVAIFGRVRVWGALNPVPRSVDPTAAAVREVLDRYPWRAASATTDGMFNLLDLIAEIVGAERG